MELFHQIQSRLYLLGISRSSLMDTWGVGSINFLGVSQLIQINNPNRPSQYESQSFYEDYSGNDIVSESLCLSP